MKVIFLDIDGVLNSVELMVAKPDGGLRLDRIDPVRLGLLKFVCDQTDAKIVITSTWRRGRDASWFVGFFSSFGWLDPPVLDITPVLSTIRGEEVTRWLENTQHNIQQYVIVDDDTDFYGDQHERLVLVDGVSGLTLNDAIAMIDILGISSRCDPSHVEELRRYV